jgi:secondary thiamine-phosphate synthase enzyme
VRRWSGADSPLFERLWATALYRFRLPDGRSSSASAPHPLEWLPSQDPVFRPALQLCMTLCLPSRDMKTLTEHLWFEVSDRRGFINITDTVEQLVKKSGVNEGLCLVNAMHISASVFINDAEDGLLHDYEVWLERLAPHEPTSQYHHNRTGEDNADAHLKRQIMGREVVVAITKGQLDFGPWEQIYYGEFDGRRRKRVLVKIIGD